MNGDEIFLKGSNNLFVTAEPGGYAFAASDVQGEAERFVVETTRDHLSFGGAFKLKQPGTGLYLFANDWGGIYFDNYVSDHNIITLRNVTAPWTPFAFSLTPTPTVLSAGKTLFLKAENTTGGPTGAVYKYRFALHAGTSQVAARDLGNHLWNVPRLAAGRYAASAQGYAYCGDTYITKASQTIANYEVCGVEITTPAAGESVPISGHNLTRWTHTTSCSQKSVKVDLFSGSQMVGEVGGTELWDDSAYWTIPSGTPATALARLRIRNAQEPLNVYVSPLFVTPSGSGRPDFAIAEAKISPTACYPGSHWIEFTVNATAPRSLKARATVTNQVTGAQSMPLDRNLTLQTGSTRHRVFVDFAGADPLVVDFRLDPDGAVSETFENNNSMLFYTYGMLGACGS
jgi:hypothetical protein